MKSLGLIATIFTILSTMSFAASLPQAIVSSDDNAFGGDVDLKIESIVCASRSQCVVRAHGLEHQKVVGLEVVIGAMRGKESGLVYRSIGAESDALLAMLAKAYKVKAPGVHFTKEVFVYGGTDSIQKIKTSQTDMKVYFTEDPDMKGYAELYTNIDAKAGILEIHEKDPEYRKNIIKAFASKY
ncbi:MAG: hypothetical protein JO142_20070 [Burkholderiales bacterium]|nr:hypothetical protein [Burkholderiales bacterium]